MQRSRIPAILAVIVAAFSVASCASHVSKSASGTIKLTLGGGRGLEAGWPGGTVPAFSSVVVSVSAADMDTITKTVSGSTGNITLELPAGKDRLVQVEAVPSAGGGAPYFALAYAGSATVDLEEGKTTTAAIALTLAKTKILLPDVSMMYLYTADSMTGARSSIGYYNYYGEYSDFEFDQYGRVYMLGMSGFNRNADLEMTGHDSITPGNCDDYGLAFAPSQNRLYYFYDTDNNELQYADISQAEPVGVWVYHPSEVMYFQRVVAADEAGSVYACSFMEVANQEKVVKMNVGSETAGYADATQLLSVPYSDIGLTSGGAPLTVQDLYAKDGVLYIAASEVNAADLYPADNAFSRGKVIALRTSDFSKLWETGWSGDANKLPTNPATQFYGPVRFVAIAPKRVYVADDGFSWDGLKGGLHYTDVDRVVELDAETGTFQAIGLDGAVSFFSEYSGTYVQNC